MRVYDFGVHQYWAAKNLFNLSPEDLEHYAITTMSLFMRRRLFREAIEANASVHCLEGCILLEAHGNAPNGEWFFRDGKRRYNMQNWIDNLDGSAAALLLNSCNRKDVEVQSKKSVVIHSRKETSNLELWRGKSTLRIYVPGEGYLDSQHSLRTAIDRLRENR